MQQGCDIDLDPNTGRRAQEDGAQIKVGMATMTQTNADCSWDSFDGARLTCFHALLHNLAQSADPIGP